MKKIMKSVVGISLASVMVIATGCGSMEKNAIEAFDKVIENANSDKAFTVMGDVSLSGIETNIEITRDANGNMSQKTTNELMSSEIYYVDGVVHYYENGEDLTDYIDETSKQTVVGTMEAFVNAYVGEMTSNRTDLDTAAVIEVTEDGDTYIIDSAQKEDSEHKAVTVAKDGSMYKYENVTTDQKEVLTFSEDIVVTLPQ